MRPAQLKIKYMIGISCLILFVFLSLLAYGYVTSSRLLEEELHRRAVSIARNLSHSVVRPIITENRIELQLLLNDSLKTEENIRYVVVFNHHGVPLAHTFGTFLPNRFLELNRHPITGDKPLISPVILNGERVANVAVTIQNGSMGSVYIGLSEANITRDLAAIARNGLPMVAVMFLVGIVGAWWYAARITRPISDLVQSLEAVGGGDFTGHILIKHRDEIGELADAFNAMLQQLRALADEQNKTEDELRLQAEMLEEEVAERQMAQEDLAVKQQQLEALNCVLEKRINDAVDQLRLKDKVMMVQGRQAAMGEMINNIAHQWRQPINNLGLLVQSIKSDYDCNLLTAQELDATVAKAMNTILFMSQTINDFSNFFSPDRMKTDFIVLQGVKRVTAMLEATLSSKGVMLLVENENDVMVSGYFNEYNQVLLNLINNAKDVVLERNVAQPLIKVIITRDENNAIVKVWDNGGGVSETIIRHVFEPYFTTKQQGEGSGIGLYMSKMIITEHFGGTLTVTNHDGGAEFVVSTPCLKSEL